MLQMHANCCRKIIVAMMQLSQGVFCRWSSSCISHRVAATEKPKQQHTSTHRHISGQELSPMRPEQGIAPLQHVYLSKLLYKARFLS